jgi:hypothetical protein
MSNAEPVSRKNTRKIGPGHFIKQYRINEQNAWKGSNYQSGAHTFNVCSNRTSILRVDRLLYHCWEIEAKNKKISYAKPEFPKIYLLASNIVMIKGSLTYPRRPNRGSTFPHKRWWWSRRSRPQGRVDPGATTSVPQVSCLVVLVHVRWMMITPGSPI